MFDGARAGLTDTVDALLADLKALGSVDAAGCSESELAAAAVALHKAQAMLAAHTARVDHAFANTRRWQADGARSPKAWLADRTGEDARTCARSLRLGRICSALPTAAAAWEAAEITSDHLRRLAAARNPRTAARLAVDEQLLVDKAKVLPYSEFDRLMTYWSMHADPDGADQDAAARRSERDVWLSQTIAGMWAGGIRLDPVSGAVVACELDRLETELFEADWAEAQARLGRKPIPAELARTSAQRRADALVEMAKRSAAMPPDAKQARVLISVLVGEGTFRNLCEVEITRQPIPPGAVREWLDDALFERILFDGPDRVLSVSHRREFPDAVRRGIQVRDRTCNGSTCDVPGLKCQIDHVDPHAAGGPTAIDNGQCLCKHDNARKGTTPGQRPPADPDRHLRWLDNYPAGPGAESDRNRADDIGGTGDDQTDTNSGPDPPDTR